MKKTYHGSCHCGAISFEAELDLDEGIRKCNCSFCWKLGYRKSFAAYEALRVTEGSDSMRDYKAALRIGRQATSTTGCARIAAGTPSRAANLD